MPRPVFCLLVSLFALLGCVRIVATYYVFSQTFDEPYHIACGMEWIEKHVYLYERQHPPLARIAVALPLYLRGLRGQPVKEPRPVDLTGKYPVEDGNAILNSNGEYMTNLAWARAGNLPFFLLSVWLLALLGDLLFGPWTAAIAVALFTLLPPVLAHAGVATTDMAPAAGLLAVIYAWVLWIEQPSMGRSALLGLAVGFAFVTKFSLLPFLAIGFSMTAIWIWIQRPEILPWRRIGSRRQTADVFIVSSVAFLVIWSIYRFSLSPILSSPANHTLTDRLGPILGPMAARAFAIGLPLRELVGGLRLLAGHNRGGHDSFLLGSFRTTGWWYYFPVVLAVKTPLAFLCLTLIGIPAAARGLWTRGDWRQNLPFLFATGILLSCMAARINIGVRHILPIYPLLSLIAAQAVISSVSPLLNSSAGEVGAKWFLNGRPMIVAALILSLAVESAWAHPDYLAWFNLLGGKHPERISVDSNLDWGQDIKRLSDRLRELKVDKLKIGYFGTADLALMGLPPFEELNPRKPVSGWIAVSLFEYEAECAKNGNYCWLHDQQPLERVGRSIFLYHLGEPGQVPSAQETRP